MEDVGNEDQAFLTRLGVTTANPEDIERHVIAEIQQKSRDGQNMPVAEAQEENIAADSLNDNVRDGRLVQKRLHTQLAALEQEIDAVAAGLESFQGEELNMEEEAAEPILLESPGETRQSQENMKQALGTGGTFLHRALVEDRLQSLKRKKKHLNKHLKFLEQDEAFVSGNIEAHEHGLSNNSLQGRPKAAEDALGNVNQTKKEKKLMSLFDDDDLDSALNAASGFVETERERLIRTGVLTPFDKVKGFERRLQTSGPKNGFLAHRRVSGVALNSNGQIEDPLVRDSMSKAVASIAAIAASRPTTKLVDSRELPKLQPPTREFRRLRKPVRVTSEEVENKSAKKHVTSGIKRRRPLPDKRWRRQKQIKKGDDSTSDGLEESKEDDSDELDEEPLFPRSGSSKIERLQMKVKQESDLEDPRDKSDIEKDPYETDVVLEGGLKVPAKIFHNLFEYQKTGVKWLWELHCQKAGGIIGDEMGLGKTIQVIAFLAALHHSGMYRPSLVVCPVTLARQWKREVQKWYPVFKAEILHISAHGVLSRSNKSQKEGVKTDSDSRSDEEQGIRRKGLVSKGADRWDSLIEHVKESESGLLITTYEQLRLLKDKILDHQWGYAILDEGHRIRNPDAETTLVCKQLQTVHRIIMTGAPIQNKLTELWSLFDFVFPGKLGVLPVFQAQFALPIAIGGYANATPLQVSTAYRCAVVLRDLVMPYLLRRMKSDVEANLPKKTEHVLFCSLTEDQRSAYRAFLASSEVEQIFDGSRNSLYGIDILRKICNHPDLLERDHSGNHPDYGNPERSGKLKVVAQVLDLWKKQGHRVLLFSQTQQMLDIIEDYVSSQGYVYRRMDGATPIAQRMALIDEFNQSDHVFVFILTTKVGGLGTNLVGANRVIIYDPDWNPSTDMQARERAWRIGQTRDVTVYRLIMRGTIEEKVYHRQIYKHFLTNKILRDPQQRRFFKARDMRDLFVLQDDTAADKTETSTLFSEVGGEIDLTEQVRQEDFEDSGKAKPDNKKVHQISDQSASTSKKRKRKRDCDTAPSLHESKGKEKAELEDDKAQEDDARILQSLFDANGIHSAMDHDAILSINDSEKMKLDHEANRVAQRAADALRQSRMMRATDHIAVPTWTGRSGEAGAPAALRRKFGSTSNSRLITSSASATESNRVPAVSRQAPAAGLAGSLGGKALSSSDLLTRMRERRLGVSSAEINNLAGDRVAFSSGSAPQALEGASSKKIVGQFSHESATLMEQLIAYFQENGGSTSSSSVIQHFKGRILPAEVPKFKQLLKQVATLHKEEAEESKWHLKQEYKVNFKC